MGVGCGVRGQPASFAGHFVFGGDIVDVKKAVRRDTVQDAERTSVRIKDETGSVRRLGDDVTDQSAVHDVAEEAPTIDDWASDELGASSDLSKSGPISAPPPSAPPSSAGGLFRSDEERATTLVLMESGAFWPAWVKEVQRRAPNSMVEVQSASESVEGFGARALRRLASLRERGVRLRAAVYAAASPATDQERGVRRLLCGTLLDTLHDGGELVLSGAGWSTWGVDARAREELMSLAGDLSCQLPLSGASRLQSGRAARADIPAGGRSVTVSVRFGDTPDESGVHKAASPVDTEGRLRKGGRDSGESDDDDDSELAREIA